ADEIVDVGDQARPIDRGVLVAAGGIVSCLGLVLRDAGRVAFADEGDGVEYGADAEWEERLEVERAGRVVGPYRCRSLKQDRAGVDSGIGPEDGDAGLGLAADQLPIDRASAAVAGEERGVKADA